MISTVTVGENLALWEGCESTKTDNSTGVKKVVFKPALRGYLMRKNQML